VVLVASGFAQQPGDSDEKLASDFWSWLARYGQYTGEDVTRTERPRGVARDWSAMSVAKQRKKLANFRWALGRLACRGMSALVPTMALDGLSPAHRISIASTANPWFSSVTDVTW